jgi:hypothetical protein
VSDKWLIVLALGSTYGFTALIIVLVRYFMDEGVFKDEDPPE